MKKLKFISTIFLLLFGNIICFGQESSKTYSETKNLLKTMQPFGATGTLSELFQIGDERINDLVFALDDKDEDVALNAQRIIRYLGNPQGTKELYSWFGKRKNHIVASGAIPLPINRWEFDFANKLVKEFGRTLESRLGSDNIYPLLLDDSKQAKELLEKVIAEMRKSEYGEYWVDRTNLIIKNTPRKVFKENGDLAKSVLQNAYFLHPSISQRTSIKLLAYNSKKSKALLDLINFGATWCVVIEKDGDGWKFFSITQTSVS